MNTSLVPRLRQRGRPAAIALACLALFLPAGACAPERKSADAVNVALGRQASLSGGEGQPAVATDGRILPEAAAPAPENAVSLGKVGDSLVLDLGAVRRVGALLLQAEAADVYFVELSRDGSAWRVGWRVPPLAFTRGLHTRTAVLPQAQDARFLRVRTTTARSAYVSEVQVFGAEPAAWPPLDRSARGAQPPLWPQLTRSTLPALFAALAALLMLVTAWSHMTRRLPSTARERRLSKAALVAVAAAALAGWPNFLNFHYGGFVHDWEFFHYFMGAKYLKELGYTRLYACAAAVDSEDGIDLGGRLARDLRDNRLVLATEELSRAAECRSRFSVDRWHEFRDDARFFRNALGLDGWLEVRRDHGFNGTPAWTLLAAPLTRLAASWGLVGFLALLDVALILASVLLIYRSFGLEASAVAAGFFGVNTLAPFGWTGGGFLRYDWLFCLIAGIAALRGKRPVLAGFALGYSALLRVFPGCALAGLFLKAAGEAVSTRSVRPFLGQARVAAGVAVALLAVGGGSALSGGGPGIWQEFAANSVKHQATISTNLIGVEAFLAYDRDLSLDLMTDPLLLDRHAAWKAQVAARSRQVRPARWLAGALAAVLLAVAARGAPPWAAAVLGLGLMPMWFVLSSYYYCALVAFAALMPVAPGVGLALAVLAWVTNVVAGIWPSADVQYAVLSLAVVIFVTGVTGVLAWRSSQGRGPWEGTPH